MACTRTLLFVLLINQFLCCCQLPKVRLQSSIFGTVKPAVTLNTVWIPY